MSYPSTPAELAAVFAQLAQDEPTATLARSPVGDLIVVVDGVDVGYVLLMDAEYHRFDETWDDEEPTDDVG